MGSVRRRLSVKGVVQGVGFRPFVYRLAKEFQLGGSVCNLGDAGVEILLEGSREAFDAFMGGLRDRLPPLAELAEVRVEELEPIGEREFRIVPSREGGRSAGAIPPDVSICPACIEEIRTHTRFRGYWATSCTDCGPRFTVIEGLPYDRPLTSMQDFPMCEACHGEYTDPSDRRYHAQTTACPSCGPMLEFDGREEDAIGRAAHALLEGRILAIKGIGGTHVACDATDGAVVSRLRRRFGRSAQPFAVMATEEMLPSFAAAARDELDELRLPQRPIVVVRKRGVGVAEEVAPGLHTVGVMLPYSGLQVLLFDRLDRPLVMTSANLPGDPMLIDNVEIEERLSGLVDGFLLHNRRIVARCDDSVRRKVGGGWTFLRRSRGYTPQRFPIELGSEPILALGPETGLAFAAYDEGGLTMSQHIGSVDHPETYAFLREATGHLRRLTGQREPRIFVHDAHPGFLTTRLAREWAEETGGRCIAVQHHVAHLASVMGEHRLAEAVGIVVDGYGYGLDGTAWGGEIFAVRSAVVERMASLRPIPMPGGDRATRFPLRVVAGYLSAAGYDDEEVRRALDQRGVAQSEIDGILFQLRRGINAPLTTSAGRFLDAVAAWTGICTERTYEGEPAMRLEAAATRAEAAEVEVPLVQSLTGCHVDLVSVFGRLMESEPALPADAFAATAQRALADGLADAAIHAARECGLQNVCVSGGVAYNDAIVARIRSRVATAGLKFWANEWTPCGDGGVAFGQAMAAGLGWSLLEADGADAAARQQQ
jgi:hydrogenase maturation protein HypF